MGVAAQSLIVRLTGSREVYMSISKCTHDAIDADCAYADGMCPLCLAGEVESLKAQLAKAQEENVVLRKRIAGYLVALKTEVR